MDAQDHPHTPGSRETVDEGGETVDGLDEQVALDRLTAAFSELLGTDGPTGDDEPPTEVRETRDDTISDKEPIGEGSCAAPPTTDDEPTILPVTSRTSPVPDRGWEPDCPEDEPPFPISPRAILEAMLFVGDPENRAISPRQAAARLRGVSPREVEQLVAELNEAYRTEGCPYTIQSSGEGYRMVLRSEFAAVRERFYGRIRQARLSQSAIDVLALVAYHQPVTRGRVDEIRGKPSGGILSQLVRRQLLRIDRTDTKPRVTRYYTTDRFLELFALDNVADLPRTQDLHADG